MGITSIMEIKFRLINLTKFLHHLFKIKYKNLIRKGLVIRLFKINKLMIILNKLILIKYNINNRFKVLIISLKMDKYWYLKLIKNKF